MRERTVRNTTLRQNQAGEVRQPREVPNVIVTRRATEFEDFEFRKPRENGKRILFQLAKAKVDQTELIQWSQPPERALANRAGAEVEKQILQVGQLFQPLRIVIGQRAVLIRQVKSLELRTPRKQRDWIDSRVANFQRPQVCYLSGDAREGE